jgi:hypothetical protein
MYIVALFMAEIGRPAKKNGCYMISTTNTMFETDGNT